MGKPLLLAQTAPALGGLSANLAAHLETAQRARETGSGGLFFPELSLTGYFLKDMTFELALEREAPEIARLVEASRDLTLGFGFVERAPDGRLYNAYALAEEGSLLHVHRKVHLVSYGMFEESRDLGSGEEFRVVETRLGRFGVLVCEDAWHLSSAYLHFLDNADALLVPSCSPARGVEVPGPGLAPGLASVRTWNTLLEALAMFTRSYVFYVNRVGVEDGVSFAGHSRAIDPFGGDVATAGMEPGELGVELDRGALRRARVQAPLRRDEKPWIVARELERHTKARPEGDGRGRQA